MLFAGETNPLMGILQIGIESFAALIGSVGFPIAAFYLMYKMAVDTIGENTKAIRETKVAIQDLRHELIVMEQRNVEEEERRR